MSQPSQYEEQTAAIREEVRRTVQQLNQLAQTEADFDAFCKQVLTDVVKITGAYGALLWQVRGNHAPKLTHQAGSPPSRSAQRLTAQDNPEHSGVIAEVVAQQKPMGLASTSLRPVEGEVADESEQSSFVLLFSPVFGGSNECIGTLELVQRSDISATAQEGYLRFLNQIAQLFPRWYERRALQQLTENANQWTTKLEYVTEVHRHLDLKETAYAIANEARRLLKCDRVSVARWNGSRCKIVAISGQDRFDNRANVVRKMQEVATSSVSADSSLWITGDTTGIAPDVARQINDYLDESHSRTLIVWPLTVTGPEVADLEMKSKRTIPARKVGAIIVEYFDDDVSEDRIAEQQQLIVTQAQLALDNSRKHSEIFLLPVFERLGRLQQFLFRDHYAKTMTGLAALGLLTLLLLFFPKELKMKVDGVMRPTERQTVFSQFDGSIIRDVLVDEQSDVEAGQVLLKLESPELDFKILELLGMIEKTELQRTILIGRGSRLLASGGQPGDREADLNDIELLNAQLRNFEKQLNLLEEKKNLLDIKSPIKGTVITPQPKRRLANLPVTANVAVLEIVNPGGPWELDLKVPQHKIGYVTDAMSANPDRPLKVEFRLGTNPNLVLEGELIKVSQRAVPSQAGNTEYRAWVQADARQFSQLQDELRTGAGVTAKIHCGTRSLGFVCFYQIIDWLRTRVFF
jgi:transcriptional regulator with GAF, ATPase, and Fis domain/multidrug efflux pump subunit AcrA (membrane-fusion protein)